LSLEISVLRFNDDEVMKDIENVCRVIETWIRVNNAEQNHPPTPFNEGGQKPTSFKKGGETQNPNPIPIGLKFNWKDV
jgi:hypothetical protein